MDKKAEYMDAFYALKSEDTFQRQAAVQELCSYVEKMKSENKDFVYIIERLIKGLSSSNQKARQGYAAALTGVLMTRSLEIPSVFINFVRSLVTTVEEKLKASGVKKQSEERELAIGQMIGYASILSFVEVSLKSMKPEKEELLELENFFVHLSERLFGFCSKGITLKPMAYSNISSMLLFCENFSTLSNSFPVKIFENFLTFSNSSADDLKNKVVASDIHDLGLILFLSSFQALEDKFYFSKPFKKEKACTELFTSLNSLLSRNKSTQISLQHLWKGLLRSIRLPAIATLQKPGILEQTRFLSRVVDEVICSNLKLVKTSSIFKLDILRSYLKMLDEMFLILKLMVSGAKKVSKELLGVFESIFSLEIFSVLKALKKNKDLGDAVLNIFGMVQTTVVDLGYEKMSLVVLVNTRCEIDALVKNSQSTSILKSFRTGFKTPIVAAKKYLKELAQVSSSEKHFESVLSSLSQFSCGLDLDERIELEKTVLKELLGTSKNSGKKSLLAVFGEDFLNDLNSSRRWQTVGKQVEFNLQQTLNKTSSLLKQKGKIVDLDLLKPVSKLLEDALEEISKVDSIQESEDFMSLVEMCKKNKGLVSKKNKLQSIAYFGLQYITFFLLLPIASEKSRELDPVFQEAIVDIEKSIEMFSEFEFKNGKVTAKSLEKHLNSILVYFDSSISLLSMLLSPRAFVKYQMLALFSCLLVIDDSILEILLKNLLESNSLDLADQDEKDERDSEENLSEEEQKSEIDDPDEAYAKMLIQKHRQKDSVETILEKSHLTFKIKSVDLLDFILKHRSIILTATSVTSLPVFFLREINFCKQKSSVSTERKRKNLSQLYKQLLKKYQDSLRTLEFQKETDFQTLSFSSFSSSPVAQLVFQEELESTDSNSVSKYILSQLQVQLEKQKVAGFEGAAKCIRLYDSWFRTTNDEFDLNEILMSRWRAFYNNKTKLINQKTQFFEQLVAAEQSYFVNCFRSLCVTLTSLEVGKVKPYKIVQTFEFLKSNFTKKKLSILEAEGDTLSNEMLVSLSSVLKTFVLEESIVHEKHVKHIVPVLYTCFSFINEEHRAEVLSLILNIVESEKLSLNQIKTGLLQIVVQFGTDDLRSKGEVLSKNLKKEKHEAKNARKEKRRIRNSTLGEKPNKMLKAS
eukprot:snap_masked-scaffold_38-processed-gene-2.53-mRNA-1 protein AED:1.00 eAED:1.00 QI:0/0/0/0/1/1/2/0/1144